MKFYETEEFKKEQKEWYEKLKDSGFRDIEITIDNEQKLLQFSKKFTLIDMDKNEYHSALTHGFFSEKSFDNQVDELILLRRIEGIRIKEISIELKQMGLRRSHRETIRYIIRKYEVRWGVRYYAPSQLSSKRRSYGRKS